MLVGQSTTLEQLPSVAGYSSMCRCGAHTLVCLVAPCEWPGGGRTEGLGSVPVLPCQPGFPKLKKMRWRFGFPVPVLEGLDSLVAGQAA